MSDALFELDLRNSDRSFADEVAESPGGDTINLCYQCGICTGTCPVSAVDDRFSPAQIIQWVRLGLRDLVLGSPLIWFCMQCHRCSFHCPQGVRFADIDQALRRMALESASVDKARVEAITTADELLKRWRRVVLDQCWEARDEAVRTMKNVMKEVLGELDE